MPCYRPLSGWRAKRPNPNGKRSIVFNKSEGFSDMEVQVPCGVCIGCRLEHSRQWAVRCMHEAQMHKDNCFITLTYNDEKLPPNGTLVKRDFQLFMKRLRRRFGKNIRYYMCGEYGPEFSRPHYHACLFGISFDDREHWSTTNGHRIYISKKLDELWTDPKDGKSLGFATVGELTFETAAYTARYCLKKRKGKNWQEYYENVNFDTGEVITLQPEFPLMSRRPGIGRTWLEKYETDVFPSDSVVVRGMEMKPPKYYANQFEIKNPDAFAKIKGERKIAGQNYSEHNTLARLHVREKVKVSRAKQLKRSYENED